MSNSKTDRLQSIGTIMALVISVIAMISTIYQTSIMHTEQKALVWPYLELSQQYDDQRFGFKVTNKGTGPAIVTSVQLDYKGKAMEHIDTLMNRINPKRNFGYNIMTNSSLNNQVFMSGEEKMVFSLPYNDETRIVLNSIKDVRVRIGYKSVLDEFWFFDSETGKHKKEEFKASIEFKN